MKKTFKHFWFVALVAVIGFSMVGCPTSTGESTNGNNGGGYSFLGPKLVISGEQVYTVTPDEKNYTITYILYTGNMTLDDGIGGTATITDGKLSYTIETPASFQTWDQMPYPLSDALTTIDNPDAQVFLLDPFTTYDSVTSPYYTLRRGNMAANRGNTSSTVTSEEVKYMYVTEDVTISREEKTETGTRDGIQYTIKENDFSLALKAGWNAICSKQAASATYSTSNPPKQLTYTETDTLSLSNPSSFKWILTINHEDDD